MYSNWKVSKSLYADGVHKHLWQPDTYFDSRWPWELPWLDCHIPVCVGVQFAIWCGHLTAGVLVVDLILINAGGHCEYSAVLGWQGPLCLGLLCLNGRVRVPIHRITPLPLRRKLSQFMQVLTYGYQRIPTYVHNCRKHSGTTPAWLASWKFEPIRASVVLRFMPTPPSLNVICKPCVRSPLQWGVHS